MTMQQSLPTWSDMVILPIFPKENMRYIKNLLPCPKSVECWKWENKISKFGSLLQESMFSIVISKWEPFQYLYYEVISPRMLSMSDFLKSSLELIEKSSLWVTSFRKLVLLVLLNDQLFVILNVMCKLVFKELYILLRT